MARSLVIELLRELLDSGKWVWRAVDQRMREKNDFVLSFFGRSKTSAGGPSSTIPPSAMTTRR
ncbi:hypothetical protein FO013_03280 [Brevibacterium aurantiacum]|uniref:Uncharacterized protein n=1 Tax=Brevibacterium aurantiacum TaxID=273384 RepID=A0A556CMC1_BREAU|nr:hypothetical protein FO013_03280 [Brevibacterium aurantiacum]